jgi:uncharacterized RDD family membrane protein YckC
MQRCFGQEVAKGESSMEHASYGRRMMASLIDGALIALVFAAIFLVAKSTVDYALTFSRTLGSTEVVSILLLAGLTALCLCIDMWFFVAVPKISGGTTGQLFTGIRLIMTDGSKPSLNAVMLRHCMSFILMTVAVLYFWVHALVPYQASGFDGMHYVVMACYGWLFLNLFVMGCNKKNRSLSDYVADTALVDKASVKEGYVYVYVDDTLSAVPKSASQAHEADADNKDTDGNETNPPK